MSMQSEYLKHVQNKLKETRLDQKDMARNLVNLTDLGVSTENRIKANRLFINTFK